MTERVELGKDHCPELTRNEYLRLLQTAKDQGDERKYLLTKLFALTGISAQDFVSVTVETIQSGELAIPGFFVSELLGYAGRQGILSGPIFLQKNGAPLNRSAATTILKSLGSVAQVAQEKCNAKALRYLFQISKDETAGRVADLVERILKRQVEDEQMMIEWEE